VSFANSITLTPGTVSIEAEDQRVVVHALDRPFQADLESGTLLGRVTRLEGEPR
jgi:multicomponent Na+:H+ antiporter subunit E